ncbi:hypothetical protein Bpla01_41250 [Burkholderia plantarii]|nr:hypothetical protein Bpla01_41250 [Burkholderia plantarii]
MNAARARNPTPPAMHERDHAPDAADRFHGPIARFVLATVLPKFPAGPPHIHSRENPMRNPLQHDHHGAAAPRADREV